ncbi:protein-glutamate methylesterase/protein-glutamine glutaminase [Pseudoduganella namucuonensis]|uniref:Protein-glutamate methylesterase/protein-glutamine glutaminase n=1 Tax=Pseudoduganella namucuonensis TaxID=1035707 RepID=A0A1I7I5S9_9BURK|nr:chemotaxis response regulator protein-glutamate methylesterase [Pseudoduganella namucuonensis]SFU68305.1 two-component system, chemotaxis family, response regulator CheB [Pseudoduganella namucuonensis]
MKNIEVLVVDDSAVVRQVLSGLLNAVPGITVAHAVADPLLAMERMRLHWPDVLLLDIEMPRMDGITFLRKIMQERPLPVVICSSMTAGSTQLSVEALSAGAVAVVNRPRVNVRQYMQGHADELIAAVRLAAGANVLPAAPGRRGVATPSPMPPLPVAPAKLTADVILPPGLAAVNVRTGLLVAIGTSTGGTQALEEVLSALPADAPGIVVVQHMPEKFTAAFAARLDAICAITVKEAETNDKVRPGLALIAPGGKHLLVRRIGNQYYVDVIDGPLVNRHRPSVDVLFRSVAKCAGANALGIIMTGMGDDGAAGLLEMRKAGARTVAQDEKSCVVYGMPMEAVKLGAVEKSVPLQALDREILQQPGR